MTNEELDEVCRRLNDTATLAAITALRAENERLARDGQDVRKENERLRKIAAHVPALTYIEAKEAAGYGSVVVAMSKQEKMDDK